MDEKIRKLENALMVAEHEKRILELRLNAAMHQLKSWEALKASGELIMAVQELKKKDGES